MIGREVFSRTATQGRGAAADPATRRRLHQAFAASTSNSDRPDPSLNSRCKLLQKVLTTYNSVCNVLSGPSNAWSLMGPLSSERPNASRPPRERKSKALVEVGHSGLCLCLKMLAWYIDADIRLALLGCDALVIPDIW